jgi:hypothetical protein
MVTDTRDSGEPGATGQTVFLNIDGSGSPDTTNISATTDSNGNFAFGTEPAGNYTVEMVLPSNATLSAASPSVTVNTGHTTSGVDVGVLPSITGTVFTDTNGDGVLDSGETGLAGRTVFLNNDGTGVLNANPSTTTDASGNFSFSGMAAGNYTVNTAYINAVYQSVLGHAPDATGLADWQQQLAAGADRITVAQGVWDSPERWGMEVDQFYQTFLDRAPDAARKAFWIDTFSKWGEQTVVAFFVTSPEYLARHAGTADFINALYHDVALRPATADDLSYWEGQIAGGESQSQAARDFIFWQEAIRSSLMAIMPTICIAPPTARVCRITSML